MFIYWKLIRSEKYIYDVLHCQGIPGEPFVPVIGQLPTLYQADAKDSFVDWMTSLVRKHGLNYFLIGFGRVFIFLW